MENFENWNKNVKKRDLNSNENANLSDFNQRDYDKEPIVIKNPYEFFLSNLFFFSHCGTVLVLLVFVDCMGIAEISTVFLWAFFGLGVLHIVATFYYYIIKNKCETKFTNKTIEFIINGEVKRVKNLSDLIPFERTFNLRRYAPIATIFMHLIIIFPVIIAEITGARIFLFFIAYHIICFCLNFLFKFYFSFHFRWKFKRIFIISSHYDLSL